MKILYVESDRIQRIVIADVLRDDGHTVRAITPTLGAKSNIDFVVENAHRYDLLLFEPEAYRPLRNYTSVDLGTARKVFADTVPRIREKGYAGTILAPSAGDEKYFSALGLGPTVQYIPKPFHGKDLVAIVQNLGRPSPAAPRAA